MKSTRRCLAVLLVGAGILVQGCATVAPWERGNLAKAEMNFDHNPAQTEMRSHAFSAREASVSGNSGAGGGCGCY